MFKRLLFSISIIVSVLLLAVMSISTATIVYGAQDGPPVFPIATPGAGDDVGLGDFELAPSLDELVEQYPGLQTYLDEVEGLSVEELDLSDLYLQILGIYDEHGASGVAVFLEDTGISETIGIPFSYLNLLTVYDSGGWEAVDETARTGGLINDQDELVGYVTIESEDDKAALTEELEALGVSIYSYRESTSEVEIGIPLILLAQYRTPDGLLGYLVAVVNVPHATGVRVPDLIIADSLSFQDDESEGGEWIGADAWHDAGFTGDGVRVGVLDLGFGGILQRGTGLPNNITANYDLEYLDEQAENHGTAVAQVIHRVAPDAELVVAYYDGSSFTSFIDALNFLIDEDVDIVNNSTGSSAGPRDGEWGDSLVITEFVRISGALWVNSAGNEAISHTLLQADNTTEDFEEYGVVVPVMRFIAFDVQTSVIMNWDGNWEGRERSNYTFTVFDSDFEEVAVAAERRSGRKNDYPIQAVAFETTPEEIYYLVIYQTRGTDNHILDIFIAPNAAIEPWAQVPGFSILVPGDAEVSLTVGATGIDSDELEIYSSQGPTTDGRIKPDITAPTNEQLFGYENGFSGTSGAAPLVAGAGALVLEAFPDMTGEKLKEYLRNNVVDLGDRGPDNVFGTGRLALPDPDSG